MSKFLSLLLFCFLVSSINAQGISFFHGEWKEALEEAKKSDKLLFIDAYAEWCGPCKKMAKNVFTQKKVGDFFNENFINLKLDMEKMDGLTFGKKYPVSAFPTLFFLDGEGNIVKKVTGGQQAEGLISIAEKAIKGFDNSGQYAEKYEAGNRDFELMVKYVTELNKVGKPSLKISNDYMNSNPEISQDQKAEFLMAAVTDSDSKLFDKLIALKYNAIKISSEELLVETIEKACLKTVDKSIEYDYIDLLDEAISQFKKSEIGDDNAFEYKARLKYNAQSGDFEEWQNISKKYLKKYGKKNPDLYKEQLTSLQTNFSYKKEAKDLQFELSEELIKKDDCTENYVYYIKLLTNDNKKPEALKYAKEAMKKATKRKENTDELKRILDYLTENMD